MEDACPVCGRAVEAVGQLGTTPGSGGSAEPWRAVASCPDCGSSLERFKGENWRRNPPMSEAEVVARIQQMVADAGRSEVELTATSETGFVHLKGELLSGVQGARKYPIAGFDYSDFRQDPPFEEAVHTADALLRSASRA
jgi:hypothetical protein